VILDEFQRFSELLDGESDAAQLARQLFDFSNGRGEFARVLLLSATPYRTFTRAEDEGFAHHQELSRLLRFLYEDAGEAQAVEDVLTAFREELRRVGENGTGRLLEHRHELERRLSSVMVRTERLASSGSRNGMLETMPSHNVRLETADVEDWVALSRLHALLRDRGYLQSSAAVAEFWKSAPWPAQFMDRYRLKDAIDQGVADAGADAEVEAALTTVAKQLKWRRFRSYRRLDPPNARARALLQDTADQSWDLLWIPPALRYHAAGPPFDRPEAGELTKRLVFSAWNLAPRAIAGLVSYEAERRAFKSHDPRARNSRKARTAHDRRLLDFKVEHSDNGERLASMPMLAWLYPSPVLSELGDPLAARRALGAERPVPIADVLTWVRDRVDERLARLSPPVDVDRPGEDQRWYWAAPLLLDADAGSAAAGFWTRSGLADDITGDAQPRAENWHRHVVEARGVVEAGIALGRRPEDLPDVLALLAVAGPGIVALRALSRSFPNDDEERLVAAARIAWGIRRMFNSPEAIAIVDALHPGAPYWQATLRYALDGNFQAVMDEWIHLLAEDAGAGLGGDGKALVAVRDRAAMALGLGTSRVEVDPLDGRGAEAWRTHFAVRYGQFREDGSDRVTHPEAVRRAFNSPFRPFVLASTSVGQEGLDFHCYCHAIVHWNLPSNPVDLEQREGRVHRYKGHAVRRNVAAAYGDAALDSDAADPWRSAFQLAKDQRAAGADDLVPYWLCEGPARIRRYVPALPHSRDAERFERLRRQVTLYRMVFGQPRQDDLVAYLQSSVGQDEAERLCMELRVDLSPSVTSSR
jgi:hypothetical protein